MSGQRNGYQNKMRFTYLRTLRKNMVFVVLGILSLSGFLAIHFFSYMGMHYTDSGSFVPEDVRDYTKFVLVTDSWMGTFGLSAGIAAFSVLTAISLFRFIANKQKVNVYYSLGITRAQLFLSNLLAGGTLLFIGIVVSFLFAAGLNVFYFGSCKELWQSFFYLVACNTTVAFLSLAVSACVFSSVGTTVEGTVYSCVALVAPTIFCVLLNEIMSLFIYGAPYDSGFYFLHGEEDIVYYDLFEASLPLQPLFFHSFHSQDSAWLTRPLDVDHYEWIVPNYRSVLVWLLITAATVYLGAWLFRRRKAEICGFLGMSRITTAFFTAVFGLIALGSSLALLSHFGFWLSAIIGLMAYALLYCIMELLLFRSFKKFYKGRKKLILHLIFAFILTLSFQNSFFGYSTRIPRLSAIESIAVTSVCDLPLYRAALYQPEYGLESFTDTVLTQALYRQYGDILLDEIRDTTQIQLLRNIHKKIAKTGAQKERPLSNRFRDSDLGVRANIRFVYKLKNGKTFSRCFDSTTVALLEELAIAQQSVWNTQLDALLQKPNKEGKRPSNLFEDYRTQLYSGILDITISNTQMDDYTVLSLSPVQQSDFLEALRKDLTAQSAQQRLFPAQPPLAVVSLQATYDMEDRVFLNTRRITVDSGLFYQEIDLRDMDYSVNLTSDMQHTLAFLKESGNDTLPETAGSVISARVFTISQPSSSINNYDYYHSYYYYGLIFTLQLAGKSYMHLELSEEQNDAYQEYENSQYQFLNGNWNAQIPSAALSVSDKNLLEELERNAYPSYFNSRNAYMVEFVKDNGNKCILFVPQDKMPQSIAEKFS